MSSLFLFLVKSTLSLSLLYLAYRLLLREETFFKLSRLVLLFLIVISVIIPFLNAPQLSQPVAPIKLEPIFQSQPVFEETVPAAVSVEAIQPSMAASETIPPNAVSSGTIFLSVYLSGIFISFLILFYSIVSVLLLFRKAQKVSLDGIRLMIIADDIPAFSFGRYILISQHDYNTNSEAIITHERSHIRMGHFYDLMLMELAKVIFWFNPLVYRLARDLKEIHEFQADHHTLHSGIDATQYQLLIIQKCVGHQKFALANSFNHCQIKNRIVMMNKHKTSKAWRWKVATFLPLLALLLMAFGRKGENLIEKRELSPMNQYATVSDSLKSWTEEDFGSWSLLEKDKLPPGKKNLNILINAKSQLMVSGAKCEIDDLSNYIRRFRDYSLANDKSIFSKIIINGDEKMVSLNPIIIRKSMATDANDYQKLLNIVGNTIMETRFKYASEIFGQAYEKLNLTQKNEINKLIPLNVYIAKPKQIVQSSKKI